MQIRWMQLYNRIQYDRYFAAESDESRSNAAAHTNKFDHFASVALLLFLVVLNNLVRNKTEHNFI